METRWTFDYFASGYDDDALPPTLGAREPREPRPPVLTGGAAVALHFTPEAEAEARAACPGVSE